MLKTRFGVEIEFTGITRNKAAKVIAQQLESTITYIGRTYGKYTVRDTKRRTWSIMSDASIRSERKNNGQIISASTDYRVELVTPILKYESDINALQEIVRSLRRAGAFVNSSCGIHIHLDGAEHTAKSIKNFINIIASKNDLLYKALQINADRMSYCKKIDEKLVRRIKEKNPKTMSVLEDLWYEDYFGYRGDHYHDSRYHFLNLHSFFNGNHTVELRGFNSTMHAGVLRSYIVLALALNHQALTQRSASSKKAQSDNDKFAMRTYLNRIGFIGEEFKNCREHLTKHLSGSAAWRYRAA